MKPIKTWILIADTGSARIVENQGPGKGLYQLPGKIFEAPNSIEHSDQQGRTFNSGSNARHKLEPHNGKNEANRIHIDTVISSLEKSFAGREFDRLIICAAPETLGIIRQRLPSQLKIQVIAELDKDLTRIPTNELSQHFISVLAV